MVNRNKLPWYVFIFVFDIRFWQLCAPYAALSMAHNYTRTILLFSCYSLSVHLKLSVSVCMYFLMVHNDQEILMILMVTSAWKSDVKVVCEKIALPLFFCYWQVSYTCQSLLSWFAIYYQFKPQILIRVSACIFWLFIQ